MKIYGMSGYNYKSTLTIVLKGQWLKKLAIMEQVAQSLWEGVSNSLVALFCILFHITI